jgi:hypothetical protein
MATTNLIVDYLVIGVTSFIWITPLLLLLLGDGWLSILTNSNNVGIGIGLLGFVYIIGISISRLADDMLDRLNDKWRDEIFGKNAKPSYHNKLNKIIAVSESASDYLSYRRSIIRITRACALNFLMGLLMWIVLIFCKPVKLPNYTELILSIASAIIFFLLIRALPTVLKGYFSTIKDIYAYLSEKETREPNDKVKL